MNDLTCNISCYAFVLSFVFSALCKAQAAQLHPRIHSIPTGTESVNGSRVDGGCKDLVQKYFCGDGSESFLTDDHDPVINTTDRNWASQLVTVRKNNRTYNFEYDHVIMFFLFQSPVSLTSIKLSLFKCPQWRIGPPNITVYVNIRGDAIFFNPETDFYNFVRLAQSQDDQSSCSGLVSVTIPLKTDTQYEIWYIVVSFKDQPDIDWVYVGEVQFYDGSLQPSASITSKPGTTTSTSTTPQNHVPEGTEGDSSPTIAVVVGVVVGGTVCVVTVLLLVLLVIMVLILVHKRRARPTDKEKEDPFYHYVLPPHMPAIPLSGDSVQLKENTAYNTTEAVTSPQVQPNIAYGVVFHY